MRKYSLVAAGLLIALAVVVPSAQPSRSAAAGSCAGFWVIWTGSQLPANTLPSFTINGPVTLQSSDFTPNLPTSIAIMKDKSGNPLPPGLYTINVQTAAGTSQLKSINYRPGNTLSYNCAENTSVTFVLDYTPIATPPSPTGPALRVVPSEVAVQQGRSILVDAEYNSGAANATWQNVSQAATWSSANTNIASYQGTGHITPEFRAGEVGTTQVMATAYGLTATANVTVTAGPPPPPTGPLGFCAGITITSNLPTNWIISGPGSVNITSPGYPNNLLTNGGASNGDPVTLPGGSYSISIPPQVPGGKDPRFGGGNIGDVPNAGAPGGMVAAQVTCSHNTWTHVGITYGGDTAQGGVLQFQKTSIDMDASSGAAQGIHQGAYLNNHFVFRGYGCSMGMNGVASFQSRGGGLWSLSEDGSKVQERQMCLDGGAASNLTYHHGINDGRMIANEGPNFVFTNSTWGACVGAQLGDGSCAVNGAGARLMVHYGWEGDQVILESTKDPDETGNWGSTLQTSNGYLIGELKIVRLSNWSEIGSSNAVAYMSFGGYLIGRPLGTPISGGTAPLKVFKLQNGQLSQVGDLPGNIVTHVSGHTYDFSTSPAQLLIHDHGQVAGPSNISKPRRLLRYKATATGLELVKEIVQKDEFKGTPFALNSFAVWGDYLIWPNGASGVIVGKFDGTTYQKVQSVTLPMSGNPDVIMASPGGYVAIATGRSAIDIANKQRTQVHLYKITGGGLPPPSDCATNPLAPGCGPTPSSTFPQYVGQTFNITYSTTSTTLPPEVLIRQASVVSASDSPKSLVIHIFGRTYNVDVATSEILNSSWAPSTLGALNLTHFANVWGTLDLLDSTLIHARRVRNPIVAPPAGLTSQSSVAPTFSSISAPNQTTAATQTQLNSLMQALQALQSRLGQ